MAASLNYLTISPSITTSSITTSAVVGGTIRLKRGLVENTSVTQRSMSFRRVVRPVVGSRETVSPLLTRQLLLLLLTMSLLLLRAVAVGAWARTEGKERILNSGGCAFVVVTKE
jgi:hypothetical protein